MSALTQRFWSNVDKREASECWEWRGHRSCGYGRVGNGNRKLRAHRLAWEMTNGPIPSGMQVLHHCDNPACCNPVHLFLGNPKENMRDKCARGRQPKGAPGKMVAPGAEHMFAHLTWDQVRAIRVLREDEGALLRDLAETYGVSERTVQDVIYQKSYREEQSRDSEVPAKTGTGKE